MAHPAYIMTEAQNAEVAGFRRRIMLVLPLEPFNHSRLRIHQARLDRVVRLNSKSNAYFFLEDWRAGIEAEIAAAERSLAAVREAA